MILPHRLMKPAATMEKLHEELKLEILLRLPVRSLLNLKCVSKSWRSIISNPNFAKLHLQLSIYSQRPNRILLTTPPQMRSIDINASLHDDSDTFNLVFPPLKPDSHVCNVGSCRGIVLLQTLNMDLFMWNPVTGAFKNIALPPRFKLPILFAFCYDESLDDYFIGLSYHPDHPHNKRPQLFEVLSLRTNSWEKLDLNNHRRSRFENCGSIFNGAIHFTACTNDGSNTYLPELIGFDITTKDLRKVPPPIVRNLLFVELGVHEGSLAFTCASLTEIFICVMREYGVKSSWTKLISLSFDQSGIGYIQPLVLFREGDEFVVRFCTEDFDEGLSTWNDRGELLEHRTYGPNRHPWRLSPPYLISWRSATAYTETLLPLP